MVTVETNDILKEVRQMIKDYETQAEIQTNIIYRRIEELEKKEDLTQFEKGRLLSPLYLERDRTFQCIDELKNVIKKIEEIENFVIAEFEQYYKKEIEEAEKRNQED